MADDSKKPDTRDPEYERERIRDQLTRVTVPPELDDAKNRERWKLEDEEGRGPYLVELNVQHVGGLPGAAEAFLTLYRELFGNPAASESPEDSLLYEDAGRQPALIGKGYYRCYLRVTEWRRLVAEDEARARKRWASDTSQELSRYR
ncbi:MAG TPA: hypothetical protein VFL57_13045, partial [Bryobacteraceae bacterium]|nr:hypothetical protein [Bryobacteraceae bacterium]